ncbi:MAG: hypothetical protein RIC14_11835 [Filomicrobium sp.]
MAATTRSKTVQIGSNAFAIHATRSENGTLHFSVEDLDCAIPEPGDDIALRFKAMVKQRLERIRSRRTSELA